jgi:peptide/nickel transport system substrate-binding protein
MSRFSPKLLCLLAVVLNFLCGCDSRQPAIREEDASKPPVYGDTFLMGSIGEPSNLLPVLSSDSASSDIQAFVYNGLLRYDKNLRIEGELAESWEVSPDNLTITFHLRKDVRWHDGRPFTAADVLFTYRLLIDPQVPTAYAERYRQVVKAETPDPYTFRVTYDKPLASALVSWMFPVHPRHLLLGQDITKSPLVRAPVGTGAYRFVEWTSGEKVVLEANDDYFEGKPYIHRVVYRIIPDLSTMFLELRNGGLDSMPLTPLQYARQTDTSAFRRMFVKYHYPDFSYAYLGFNLRRPMFQDIRVRRALAHALDKQELVDGVLLGLGMVATGPYKPGTWPYNPRVRRYAYDPAEARRLLEEAGWRDRDGDGVREKDGQRFSFTIVTNQGNDQRIKAGEIIQRRFREVGVEVKLRVIEWAAFLKDFINPGNFDATILAWTIVPDPDAYNVWHSSKTAVGELNFVGFKNAEVDRLLEEGRRTLDRAKRKVVYDRFQEILADQQPYIFLYVPEALPVVAKRFHGIEPAPSGIMHNFIRWYVPAEQQKYQR